MGTKAVLAMCAGLIATVSGGVGNALGAGFYLPEVGSPASLGTAGVANPTNNYSADAAWTNPAGMTGIEKQHVMSGLQFAVPKIEFDVKGVESEGRSPVIGDDGGNAGIVTPIPSFFYVTPVSDDVRFGFSVTGPLGGGVDYGNQFAGRYSVQNVVLGGIGFTPSVSYKVNDKLSIGAGLSVIYTFLDEKIAVRQPEGAGDATVSFSDLTSWGAQVILGLTYEFTDRLMLGVVYRSQADTDLEGDLNVENWRLPVTPPDEIEISWTNPQWLEAGLSFDLNDKTTLFVNLGWQEWSKFSENELSVDTSDNVKVLDRNWDDTWHTGAALLYQLSDNSHVSLGFAYESSPVKDAYRTLDFPVDEIWKLSAAYGWDHGDKLRFAVGATIYFVGDAAIDQTSQGVRVTGDFSSNKFAIVGGTLRYEF